jgi:hypothetical protein
MGSLGTFLGNLGHGEHLLLNLGTQRQGWPPDLFFGHHWKGSSAGCALMWLAHGLEPRTRQELKHPASDRLWEAYYGTDVDGRRRLVLCHAGVYVIYTADADARHVTVETPHTGTRTRHELAVVQKTLMVAFCTRRV